MALKTLGSNNTTILQALVFNTNQAAADMATLANGIKNDQINGLPIATGAISNTGLLYVPNRGILQALPGDYIAIDSQGWPILISKQSIAAGGTSWTHN